MLSKLFYMAQCFQSARLCHNRQSQVAGVVTLNEEFKKDINWFRKYLAGTNSIFMIDQDARQPVHICVDTCTTGFGTMCQVEVYHTEFSPAILQECHPICELEAVNTVVALKRWTSQL